jgi:hypothetical protein
MSGYACILHYLVNRLARHTAGHFHTAESLFGYRRKNITFIQDGG